MWQKLLLLLIILLLWGCAAQPNPTAAMANLELGLNYLQQGQMELAHAKLLLAQQESSQNSQVLDGLAIYYEKIGDIDRARHYYQRALRRPESQGAAENNYGAFLCRQGLYLTGLHYLQQAASRTDYLKPAMAYENAGHCALQIPNPVLARHFFLLAKRAG